MTEIKENTSTKSHASTALPALARKHRWEVRKLSRDINVTETKSIPEETSHVVKTAKRSADDAFSSAPSGGTKDDGYKRNTQVRYNPDVPMTEEQLASWRREQRRIRNRDSAALSRQRTREQISELENQVDDWKKKYEQLEREYRILNEFLKSNGVGIAAPPDAPRTDISPTCPRPDSWCETVGNGGAPKNLVSPVTSPALSAKTPCIPIDLNDVPDVPTLLSRSIEDQSEEETKRDMEVQQQQKQHLTEMISRPA